MGRVTDETIVAALANGDVEGPVESFGNWWFVIRVTGTNVAYRPKSDEFVARPADDWLSESMCSKFTGCPIIVQHPENDLLDGPELRGRVVGTVVHCFPRGDELMAIGRIIDQEAGQMMSQGGFDTSPAVRLSDDAKPIEIDGDKIMIETADKVLFVDHVALCPIGVWSKGGPPSGVEVGEENRE